jgi:hypothetical protein
MSLITQQNPLGGKVITDTSTDATAAANVTGAASNLFYIEVDNTANSAASYFKVYNHASPTVGTTVPDIVVRAAASSKEYFICPQGVTLGTGLSYACTTAGGTAGTGSPSSAVIVRMIAS